MKTPPGIGSTTVTKILRENFRVHAEGISRLDGYENVNYLIKSKGRKFVLKQYDPKRGLAERLEAESRILEMLSQKMPDAFQKPVKTDTGKYLAVIKSVDGKKLFRLLRFVEGDLLSKVPHTMKLFESLGRLLGRMDRLLYDIRDEAVEAYRHEWDLLEADRSRKYFDLIEDASDRRRVKYFHLRFHDYVVPLIPDLRKSIIHGDANDLNVLVNGEKVTGLIDFGDMTYSLLINELAIALTYIMFGKADPLSWAVPVIKAYSEILPLMEEETGLLYDLIGTRLCITISRAAKAKRNQPHDPYLTVSLAPARQLLRQWTGINPLKATDVFRHAAGFETMIRNTTAEDQAASVFHPERCRTPVGKD